MCSPQIGCFVPCRYCLINDQVLLCSLRKKPKYWTGQANPLLSVDALEQMMEDPTVQKMIFP